MNRYMTTTLAMALLALLAGCATAAKPDAMVPQLVTPAHKSGADVSIAVSGGKETSAAHASQISDAAFAQALTDTIQKSALFAKVSSGAARYRLTAFIGKVDQPTFGFSMTVKMEVSYSLTDTKSGKNVWTQNIASEHTAHPGEAFAGVERLRLANEGAAQENIRLAVEAMGALSLE